MGSPDLALVNTFVNLHNDVSISLFDRPNQYRLKFMNHEGRVVVRDWAAGFMLKIALRRDEWSVILLTGHRKRLAPMLVALEGGPGLLPDMPAAKKLRLKQVAHDHIADAV